MLWFFVQQAQEESSVPPWEIFLNLAVEERTMTLSVEEREVTLSIEGETTPP